MSDSPTVTRQYAFAVATDGGQPVEDDDSDGSHGFAVGVRVMDRDDDDPNPAVVVALPDEPAYAREIDALDGASVADVNPEYGASGAVATVAYTDDLDAALDVWCEAAPDALARICVDEDVRTYDFPTARLREATTTDGGRTDDDTDANAASASGPHADRFAVSYAVNGEMWPAFDGAVHGDQDPPQVVIRRLWNVDVEDALEGDQ